MDLAQAVIVPKATKVEHDMRRLGMSRDQLHAYYRADSADIIFASHERQLEMRKRVSMLLPEAGHVTREQLTRDRLQGVSLVVALGGDNHFIYVTHFVDATPIVGINADRVRSHGGLLALTEENVEGFVTRLRERNVLTQAWTRIEASVDGRIAGRATSEFYVGEQGRKDMTRHVLGTEEQRCSGLLVATGAGSTGWYGAYGTAFDRTAPLARWVATEPFPHGHSYAQATGELTAGGELVVRSRNDAHAILSVDCLEDAPFPYGSVASFRLSDVPLRVVL